MENKETNLALRGEESTRALLAFLANYRHLFVRASSEALVVSSFHRFRQKLSESRAYHSREALNRARLKFLGNWVSGIIALN